MLSAAAPVKMRIDEPFSVRFQAAAVVGERRFIIYDAQYLDD